MMLTIFKKIKNEEKGGVEFIESSIVFPVVLLFISLLIILSISTLYRIYTFEKVYKEARKDFYEKESDNGGIALSVVDLFNKKKIGSDMTVNNRKFHFDKHFSPFNTKINSTENQEKYLETSRMDTDDIIRKLDFMKEIYMDIRDLDSFKNIDNFTKSISNMKDNLMNKLMK